MKCASLVMAAPGYCEAQLDGRKVGDRMLDPPPADFTKRVYASELPLELAPGRHELTVLLGHGRLDQRASSAWNNDRDKWRMEPCLKAALVEAVRRADGRFRGGVIGSKHVFRALSRAGRSDLAFDMLTRRGSPGFMHWREKGGTALWEDWWGGFSRNHVMFADFACWAYQWLGGLRLAEATGSTAAVPVPEKSGMGSVVVAPDCIDALEWARALTETARGRLACEWRRLADGAIELRVDVPPETQVRVVLPRPDSGGARDHELRCSGSYVFVCPANGSCVRAP